jgi:hypothetical protein
VQARAISSSSVIVQWEPPTKPNGELTGYIVYYTVADGSEKTLPFTSWQTDNTATGRTTSITLKGLLSDANYAIRVQAKNVKGAGDLSAPIFVITTHGSRDPVYPGSRPPLFSVPGQPVNLQASAIGAHKMLLTWDEPLSGAEILGYVVQHKKAGSGKEWKGTKIYPK